MASYETKTFKGTMKYLKLSPQAKKSKFLEINCSHYQATVLIYKNSYQELVKAQKSYNLFHIFTKFWKIIPKI